MPAIDHHQMQALKDISVIDGVMSGDGYLLSRSEFILDGMTCGIEIVTAGPAPLILLFGWVGIGSHFRLHVDPTNRILAVYQVRDGIPLYLHHVSIEIPTGTRLEVSMQTPSVKIRMNGFCLMDVLAELPARSRWGLSAGSTPSPVPSLNKTTAPATPHSWICLGDGFSNSRWRNRHFINWPEILFGRTNQCLNACVAAANTRRVLEVAHQIQTHLAGTTCVVAAGSDDLIEGEPLDAIGDRIRELVSTLHDAGAKKVHLATPPPRRSARQACLDASVLIRTIAEETSCGILDFHDWLLPHADSCMVGGEYPGEMAQTMLAQGVARTLELPPPSPPGVQLVRRSMPAGKLASLARKISRRMDACLGDYPGLLK